MVAEKRLVAEHVAAAPQRRGRCRVPAMRTDQREIPCTPAQHKMSQPVHVCPLHRRRADALRGGAEHRWSARKSGKGHNPPLISNDRAASSPTVPYTHDGTAITPSELRGRGRLSRGSPTMNRVPRGCPIASLMVLRRYAAASFGIGFRLFRGARAFEISVTYPRLTSRFCLSREYCDAQHVSQ